MELSQSGVRCLLATSNSYSVRSHSFPFREDRRSTRCQAVSPHGQSICKPFGCPLKLGLFESQLVTGPSAEALQISARLFSHFVALHADKEDQSIWGMVNRD